MCVKMRDELAAASVCVCNFAGGSYDCTFTVVFITWLAFSSKQRTQHTYNFCQQNTC